MTHSLASLLHHLASYDGSGHVALQGKPELCEALPRALELGLISHPGNEPLERFHARLTEHGRRVVAEGLCAMEAVA